MKYSVKKLKPPAKTNTLSFFDSSFNPPQLQGLNLTTLFTCCDLVTTHNIEDLHVEYPIYTYM